MLAAVGSLRALGVAVLLAPWRGLWRRPIASPRWAEDRSTPTTSSSPETTPYQRIVLTRVATTTSGSSSTATCSSPRATSTATTRRSCIPALAAHARVRARVLVLGGGDGLAVREILALPGRASTVTLVDLDPEMTRLFADAPASWLQPQRAARCAIRACAS